MTNAAQTTIRNQRCASGYTPLNLLRHLPLQLPLQVPRHNRREMLLQTESIVNLQICVAEVALRILGRQLLRHICMNGRVVVVVNTKWTLPVQRVENNMHLVRKAKQQRHIGRVGILRMLRGGIDIF